MLTLAGYAWRVYHVGANGGVNPQNYALSLNATTAQENDTYWNNTAPTSTNFTVNDYGQVNASGENYVAYLFAHNAGGFGLTGLDNVISCGSFTTDGSTNATINLGWEPQWILTKDTGAADDWRVSDNMRGLGGIGSGSVTARLVPNTSGAENSATGDVKVFATGANISLNASRTYIYIAIRRGPMEVPTSGTSVYNAIARTGTGAAATVTGAGFPLDLMISHSRNVGTNNVATNDRLRGAPQTVNTNTTGAEFTSSTLLSLDQDGFSVSSVASGPYNSSGETNVNWLFRRAPGFFDEVCYTGTGTSTTQAHNLGAVPELMIIKSRGTAGTNWSTYSLLTPTTYRYNTLQTDNAGTGGKSYGPGGSPNFEELSAQPTSTVINLASSNESNSSGRTFVAYLFATLAGVSKVGSYTGNGSSQTINCGFTGGARLVLIKRTDSTGDWYVWDSSRGIIAGNDPHLSLNSTAAEVTTDDSVDTDSTGFVVNQVAATNVNVTSASYIFLAVA
jgi:hypothetical protein